MKITRFFIVGASNTLLTYLLYVVLLKLGTDYKFSLFFVYLFGIIFGYLLNRYWTFSINKQHRLSFIRYLIWYIVVFILNLLFLIFLVDFHLLNPIYAQLLVLLILSLVSFLVQKNWVFVTQVKP
jgi:putative flippase GtrA